MRIVVSTNSEDVMIFPGLSGDRIGYVNLDTLATAWKKANRRKIRPGEKNPLLIPETCDSMIRAAHLRLFLGASYGGWMEMRNVLWNGSYITQQGMPLHLGVDVNAWPGLEVAIDQHARVLRIDDDHPEPFGWGPRVMFELLRSPFVLVYAHLNPLLRCAVGDTLAPGDVIGTIGEPSHNGGWFPHVHVQAMAKYAYEEFERDPASFDGYGKPEDIKVLAQKYPDPMRFIRFE